MSTFDRSPILSANKTNSSGFETEINRLQRDIEHFSQCLETERRNNMLLDEQIRRLNNELSSKKVKKTKQTTLADRQMAVELKTAEAKLQSAMQSLNSLQAENRQTRAKIDVGRREKLRYLNLIHKLTTDIDGAQDEAETNVLANRSFHNIDKKQKKQITLLRSKSCRMNHDYNAKVAEMQSIIQQDQSVIGKEAKKIEETINQHLKKSPEVLDPTEVMMLLQHTWTNKLRDKKKELDAYLKYLHSIESSFREIQSATGIRDYEEFVTIFVKSEDQHHALYTYVTQLNMEIDALEESVAKLKRGINECLTVQQDGEQTSDQLIRQAQSEVQKATEKLDRRVQHLTLVKDQIKTIYQPIRSIIEQFNESELELQVATEVKLDDLTETGSVIPLIAEIEEFINEMETYLAYKRHERLAAVISVPHEQMTNKDFNRQSVSVRNIIDSKIIIDEPQIEEAKTPLPRSKFKNLASSIMQSRSRDTFMEVTPPTTAGGKRTASAPRGGRKRARTTYSKDRSFL